MALVAKNDEALKEAILQRLQQQKLSGK
jgi:hypothetical protein